MVDIGSDIFGTCFFPVEWNYTEHDNGQLQFVEGEGMLDKNYYHSVDGSVSFSSDWKRRKKRFVCHYCNKDFVLEQDRDGHMNAKHLNLKPYQCNFCLKKFSFKRKCVDHKNRLCLKRKMHENV